MARAQDAPPDRLFRVTSEIVQFDALFVEGQGRPVTDIRKEEVTVRQAGMPVPLRDLRFQPRPRRAGPPSLSDALPVLPTAPRSAAVAVAASADLDVEPSIFLIDDLAMSPGGFDRVKAGLRVLFEQELPSGVEVGLLRTGELGTPKTQLTADRAVLQTAVSQLRYKVNRWRGGLASRSGAQGAGDGRGDRVFLEGTLGSLNSLILNLRPLPGRKERRAGPARDADARGAGVLRARVRAARRDVDDRGKARFVPVTVSVSRPGVTVRTRQGFFTR